MYKLTVHVNEEDDGKELSVSHMPSMLPDECRRVGLTIHSEHLSMEKLLMQTIEVRTRAKLKVHYLFYLEHLLAQVWVFMRAEDTVENIIRKKKNSF